jgi:release factor glutamine methyltransferase
MSAMQAARVAAQRLAVAGVPSQQVDAELLVAHALGIPRSRLVLNEAPDPEVLEPLVARRERREPLQHITGTAPFRRIELKVGPGVFVPRPETELLVDLVYAALTVSQSCLAVDLCAGSGALAAAMADEVPGCTVHAVEASPEAYAWLSLNVAHPVLADVRGALVELDGTVDVVVANPPYLVPGMEVEPEVSADPAMALWGGGPGALDEVRMCIAAARRLLRPGGLLAIEHDVTHDLALLLDGFTDVGQHVDLTGRPRFTTATRV